MRVIEFAELTGMEIVAGKKATDIEIEDGYCCDLLSEVMGKALPGSLWMTVHGHLNIVGVAVLKELAGVVVTGGYTPDPETIQKADEENIPLMLYGGSTFSLAGKLHETWNKT